MKMQLLFCIKKRDLTGPQCAAHRIHLYIARQRPTLADRKTNYHRR